MNKIVMVYAKSEGEVTKLTAVVIADSFDRRFSPILAQNKSMGAFKICNIEILNYTFQWIAWTEIQDVILAISNDRKESLNSIVKYWRGIFDSFRLLASPNCVSVGEVIREINGRGLITSDFILIANPATFCSTDLCAQIATFKERRRDRKNVLTLLYTLSDTVKPFIVIDPITMKLLAFHHDDDSYKLEFDKKNFLEKDKSIRSDLEDTGIALCSASIASQFSDNFDFQHRDDIIRELLARISTSIFFQLIHLHLEFGICFLFEIEKIASSIDFFRILSNSYDHLDFSNIDYDDFVRGTRLIAQQWLIPFPNIVTDENYFSYPNNIFISGSLSANGDDDSKINLASVGPNVVIGRKCEIAPDVLLNASSIGEGAKIGHYLLLSLCKRSGTNISMSAIGESVLIGNSTKISCSFIGDAVSIGDKVTIEPHCVIGHVGCILRFADEKDFWFACKYHPKNGSSYADEDLQTFEDASDDELNIIERFFEEVKESMERIRGVKFSDQLIKNLILEINSSKLAYNISVDQVAYYVFLAFLHIHRDSSFADIRIISYKWKTLFTNYYKPVKNQIQALAAMEEYLSTTPNFKSLLAKTVHMFYESDIIEEDAILSWYESVDSNSSIYELVKPIVSWLKEADEEDSD
ncbi:unnamed protein product [Dracunculus medinensis]|uniref:Translation initiation factor eIF2B subunit epsilon n=1 Tax=Dracunculus medinensis TaxID=318479 RepID=A0A158Q5N4_DRAME|nr:unnamed protein product [Dracunculus medinensis]